MTTFDELDPVPEVVPENETPAEPAAQPQVIYTHDKESVEELRSEIASLRDLFTRRLMEDKQKNELIRTLGDEAKFAFIEPFLYDLILLLDRLDRAEDEFSVSVRDELFDILRRRGLTRIDVKPEYDPRLYKAVRVTESADVSALTVTGVIRRGYIFSGKVIRPAEVIVAKPGKA